MYTIILTPVRARSRRIKLSSASGENQSGKAPRRFSSSVTLNRARRARGDERANESPVYFDLVNLPYPYSRVFISVGEEEFASWLRKKKPESRSRIDLFPYGAACFFLFKRKKITKRNECPFVRVIFRRVRAPERASAFRFTFGADNLEDNLKYVYRGGCN